VSKERCRRWEETIPMRLSARNQLKGKVVGIEPGAVNAMVTMDVGGGNIISATVSMAAVKDLGLEVGKDAYAIIKATSVMIGVN
jgi:molybdopterin-binding protein